MDEYIEEYDYQGNPTGKRILKSYAHKNGLFHSTIHLWLYTVKGDLLIQKRSKSKKINPDVWDIISVAGHIEYSESITDAAIREAYEEVGLKLKKSELKKIGTYFFKNKYKNLVDAEFHNAFICEIKKESLNMKFKNNEVDELKFIHISELKKIVENKSKGYLILDNSLQYYKDIFSEINSKINQDS